MKRIIVKGFIQCKRICQTVCDRYSGDGCVGSLHEKYIICVDLYIYGDSRWDDEHYNHEHG